jgi:hypothetical protein
VDQEAATVQTHQNEEKQGTEKEKMKPKSQKPETGLLAF